MIEKKPHPQIVALEKGLENKGITRTAFYKKANITKETYQNWRTRGLPAKLLLKISKMIECDPYDFDAGIFTKIDKEEKDSRVIVDLTNLSTKSQRRIQKIIHTFDDDGDIEDTANSD